MTLTLTPDTLLALFFSNHMENKKVYIVHLVTGKGGSPMP